MRSPWIVLTGLLAWAGAAFAAVDANTASVDALQSVRGVGPTIAQRIVDERRRGPYSSLDDLQARVRGIGEASVRKMSAAGLTVGGAARLPAVGGVGRVHEVAPAGPARTGQAALAPAPASASTVSASTASASTASASTASASTASARSRPTGPGRAASTPGPGGAAR